MVQVQANEKRKAGQQHSVSEYLTRFDDTHLSYRRLPVRAPGAVAWTGVGFRKPR